MGSEIRFADFKRKFAKFGVVIKPGGKHHIMTRSHEGAQLRYTVPTRSGRYVKDFYVAKARQALKLTPEYGISDEDFDNA